MNHPTLPSGYRRIITLELKRNSRLAITVNALAAAAVVPLLILGLILKPIGKAYAAIDFHQAWLLLLQPLFLIIGIAAYTFLHEGVQGLLIRIVTGTSPTFGFSGLSLYACSDRQYIGKKTYLLLSLGPSAFLFLLLLILNIALPDFCFWIVYFVQMVNITGMVGDVYIAGLIRRMPEDLLVRDRGVDISFYSKEDFVGELLDFGFIVKIWKEIKRYLHRIIGFVRSRLRKLKEKNNRK